MKLIKLTALAVVAIVVARTLPAGLESCTSAGCATEGCASGSCGENVTCHPTVKTEKIKKVCWDVEEEYICVPKVRCPLFDFLKGKKRSAGAWTAGCGENCASGGCAVEGCSAGGCNELVARVRKIRKAVKREVDCGEKCVVDWESKRSEVAGCASPGCAAEGCTARLPATTVNWSATPATVQFGQAPTATPTQRTIPRVSAVPFSRTAAPPVAPPMTPRVVTP